MPPSSPGFELLSDGVEQGVLKLFGDWVPGPGPRPQVEQLARELRGLAIDTLTIDAAGLGEWDSHLPAFLLGAADLCREAEITLAAEGLPQGARKLLQLATAVPPHRNPATPRKPFFARPHLAAGWREIARRGRNSLSFVGELSIALGRLIGGRANTRYSDFRDCCYQAGPDAFAIITLTSVLVGMILAYLGAVQLRQFGAEIYVADLVVIGTLREMGVLMTAVVMAGRTGAAYAAQLGTMQTNDEIDAVITMGISPTEFLVLPRLLALMVMMPLLTLYANLLGIIGGGIVAGGMGIAPLMYLHEGQQALSLVHLNVGLAKSVVFGLLIAVAGCRAGMNCGRSSAAVGQAATEAVVTAVVYLIIADAAFNIIFQQVGI